MKDEDALMKALAILSLLWFLAAAAAAKPPNVLMIAVDDLRPELGCYGSRAVTPHIDALAASGLRFERAYCNQAVCGASRVSLMTGLYPERTGERTYHVTDWRKRHAEVITLNQHLKANGYTAVGLGKIFHNTAGPGVDPEHWNQWIRVSGQAVYADPTNAEIHRQQGKIQRPGRRSGYRGPATESAEVSDETYADGARASIAIEQLKTLAATEEPFFLAVGFTKPHLPFIAPKRYWDLYQRDQFSLPPNQGVPPGYPEYARNAGAGELRAYSDIPKQGSPTQFTEALNRRLIHGYHACVSYLDAQVGRLLAALTESGAGDHTIVIFWADHGWKLGDHASWCKHTNFECDTRVPLIVRAPGQTRASTVTHSLTELIDLYPTLCDLTGLEKPAHLQGRSFARVLQKPEEAHRSSAYSSYPHGAGKDIGRVIGHSIRTADYRFTQWWQEDSDRVVDSVLTAIAEDPGETTRVRDEEREASLASLLARRVRAARGAANAHEEAKP